MPLHSASCGTGSGLLLLIPPAFLGVDRSQILRNAFAGDRDQTKTVTLQWIMPANGAGLRVQTENFTLRGRQHAAAIEDHVDETSSLECGGPPLLACGSIQREHRTFDANINDLR